MLKYIFRSPNLIINLLSTWNISIYLAISWFGPISASPRVRLQPSPLESVTQARDTFLNFWRGTADDEDYGGRSGLCPPDRWLEIGNVRHFTMVLRKLIADGNLRLPRLMRPGRMLAIVKMDFLKRRYSKET